MCKNLHSYRVMNISIHIYFQVTMNPYHMYNVKPKHSLKKKLSKALSSPGCNS